MELTACHVTGGDVTSTDRRKRSLHLRDVYQEGQVSCLGLRGAPILETSRNKVILNLETKHWQQKVATIHERPSQVQIKPSREQ